MRGLAPISKKFENFGENVARRAGFKNLHLWSQPSTGSPLLAIVFTYRIKPFGIAVEGPAKLFRAAEKWMIVTMLG